MEKRKQLGNLLSDLFTNGCFKKKNWVIFKYLEYSDFHVGGKGAVLMLCLDRQDTPTSPEGGPAVSGQRAWDLWAAVAREGLWRQG